MELADGWAEVWDVPPVVLEKTHYLLPRRRCCCGATTTAAPPLGSAGSVSNLHVHAVNDVLPPVVQFISGRNTFLEHLLDDRRYGGDRAADCWLGNAVCFGDLRLDPVAPHVG
jgi:hypothetical protein